MSIGYIGHFYKGKGLEVISKLPEKFPDLDFYLIGGIGKEFDYWKGELSVYENVYMTGHVDQKTVRDYLCMFDIVLAPLQKEINPHGNTTNISEWTSPLKIFEYMSSGATIVASNLDVLKEVLEDGVNCLLCKSDDISEWEESLTILKKNKNLRSRLSAAAKNKFISEYTWKIRAKNIVDELRVTHD